MCIYTMFLYGATFTDEQVRRPPQARGNGCMHARQRC